jgi:hypothetical protein
MPPYRAAHAQTGSFMTTRSRPLLGALVALACSAVPPTNTVADAPAPGGAGELWEVTTAFAMKGFATPPQTRRTCRAKVSPAPPGATQHPGCENSDFEIAGNKTTWRVACSGPPKMTGTGEMTLSADAYDGKIRLSSTRGVMSLKLSGKRVGACTPGRN